MNDTPKYIIVRLDRVAKALGRLVKNPNLPTLDMDAILSGMVEALERPLMTNRNMDDAVKWLMYVHGLREIHIEEWDYEEAQSCFYLCLMHIRQCFQDLNPYTDNRLNYRYKERRGLQSAILEYSPMRG